MTTSPTSLAPVRVQKSNRNASDKWNGFSYQGKVGLLVGIIALKDHMDLSDHELAKWYFEYEISEDVTVANSVGVVSKHQVKSFSSSGSHLYSTYTTAIGDFEITDTPEDARYLHVATEIGDFDEANDQKVALYCYPNGKKYCKLSGDQIFTFCRDEVASIRTGISDNFAEGIVYFLLHQISVLINIAHDSLDGGGEIVPARMNLLDLKNYILNSSVDKIAANAEHARLKNSISKIWDDHREYVDDESEIDEARATVVTGIVRELTNLPYEDMLELLCFIHPDVRFKDYGQNINIDGFKDVFLESLIKCTQDYDCEDGLYNFKGEHFIPTTINRSDSPMHRREVAQGIVNNYDSDSRRLLFEKSTIINESIDGDLLELAEVNIRNFTNDEKGLEHVMGYTGSRLMNVNDAIDTMNLGDEE